MIQAFVRALVVALNLNPKQVVDILARALGYMTIAATALNTAIDIVKSLIASLGV